MKRLIAIVCTMVCVIAATAQYRSIGMALTGADKPQKLYMGQLADNMRDHTGTGMQLYKDGSIYIGDFVNGKPAGYGMYICTTGQTIKDLPGTVAFVGEWIGGKKNGRGTCYGADGEIIYSGLFDDNKPAEVYPMAKIKNQHYFTDWEDNLADEYYIGEMLNGRPDGYGIYVLSNGARSIGRVRNGHRTGISILIYDPTTWQVVKYDPVATGYEVITDNSHVEARKVQFNAATAALKAQLSKEFSEFAAEGLKLANSYAAMRNGNNGDNTYSGSTTYSTTTTATSYGTSTSSGTTKSAAAKSSSKTNDCGTAWMTAKRVYSDYETQLVPNGARYAKNPDQRKEIRKKMRDIREKWVARGCQFTKSPYESD